MFHGRLDYFQKPPLGGRPNTKPEGDHGTLNAHNRWFILFLSWLRIPTNRNSLKMHLVRDPVTCDFTLNLRVHDHTTWFWQCVGTVAFGHFLLGSHMQFHGHGSWLMCEVALRASPLIHGYASASGTEKWPPSRLQMQTHAKLPPILHLST